MAYNDPYFPEVGDVEVSGGGEDTELERDIVRGNAGEGDDAGLNGLLPARVEDARGRFTASPLL